MTKTFTYDDVIRYSYAETTKEENELIQAALQADDRLMDFYLDLLEIRNQMEQIKLIPSSNAIQGILNYSMNSFHGLVRAEA